MGSASFSYLTNTHGLDPTLENISNTVTSLFVSALQMWLLLNTDFSFVWVRAVKIPAHYRPKEVSTQMYSYTSNGFLDNERKHLISGSKHSVKRC